MSNITITRDLTRGQDPADRTLSSIQRAAEIISEVVSDPRVGIPERRPEPIDLTAEDDGIVRYDLQAADHRFLVDGVVGRITERHFRGMVHTVIDTICDRVGKTLRGEWRVVAARVDVTTRRRIQRVASGVVDNSAPEISGGTVKDNAPMHDLPEVDEQDILLELALAEVTRRPPICPLFEERNRRGGQRYAFAESGGRVSTLGPSDRAKRLTAKRIIMESTEGEVHHELTSEQRDQATTMFIDWGYLPGRIGTSLGVPRFLIDKLVEELEAEAGEE